MKRRTLIAGLGSAAAWPVVARAQRAAIPVIGYLSSTIEGDPADASHIDLAFRQGLGAQSFVEGKNVGILYRRAEGQYDRLPGLAADLVSRQIAVIFASTPIATALAAKRATSIIPIVFVTGADPVKFGLVESLSRPTGNLTGVAVITLELLAKRLGLLRQVLPAVHSIGFLANPTNPQMDSQISDTDSAARLLGLKMIVQNAGTSEEIGKAFSVLAKEGVGGVLVAAEPFFYVERDRIALAAADYGMPMMSPSREYAQAGALMSYGPNFAEAWRLAGTYVGRILKGEKPSDLPVQQSTKVDLVLNTKTAKAMGLEFPPKLLAVADEVIE
jgi:putative tryptophan/tyrosine transport system substrate-binding protein